MKRIRTRFLTGIAVILPTVVTVWLLWRIFNFLDGLLAPMAERWLPFQNRFIDIITPIAGAVTLFGILVLVGFFAGNFLGRKLLEFFERIVHRVPLAGKIYLSVKQIMDVFVHQKLEAFQSVVFFQYPREGLWAMGFISRETPVELAPLDGERFVNIFVPTSPNPTSGFVLLVPESQLHPTSLTVEEALKLVVSGGAYVPERIAPSSQAAVDDGRREA